jgi:CheY-like chemotaxis protein
MTEPGSPPPHKVLVIESDEAHVEMIGAMLLFCGCEPTLARTGAQALSHVATGVFDLVLIDHACEGFDGQAIYRNLTAQCPELADRVVFMTSVDGGLPQARQFLAWAGRPTITKPFGIGNIETIVKEMIET